MDTPWGNMMRSRVGKVVIAIFLVLMLCCMCAVCAFFADGANGTAVDTGGTGNPVYIFLPEGDYGLYHVHHYSSQYHKTIIHTTSIHNTHITINNRGRIRPVRYRNSSNRRGH